jgi:hypothetical protein
VGSNGQAMAAAREKAESLGYQVIACTRVH